MRYLFGFLCVCALGVMPLMGCSDTGGTPADNGPYASKDLWLCRPDIENDHCDTADLSTTEIQPDGTMVTLAEVAPNPDAEVDCFYVYHTVDWRPEAGNTETLIPHPDDVVKALERNGAHYRGVCRMFAPLYRQMTLGTYGQFLVGLQETEFFQKAYGDVAEAFEYYMRRFNAGRGLVLIGHSQGSGMLTKLLQDKFDDDEALRTQLVSALLIGGGVEVPEGDRAGGSFMNIPLCAAAGETGCAITFRAIAAGEPPPTLLIFPPAQLACVNPASFDGGTGTLAALIYSRSYDHVIPFPDGVDTEWVRYPQIYESRCSGGEGFRNVLEVDCASGHTCDVPMTPQELQESLQENWGLGPSLHLGEYFIANTDLRVTPVIQKERGPSMMR
ncbi:MAG: DUF3089 domain-containing protein [Deltaproteobacteria bacterium]|nr:DUF3089 domain-containing protein [Deltaproteobacteria bacterium]